MVRKELVYHAPTSERGIDYSVRLNNNNIVFGWEAGKFGCDVTQLKQIIKELEEFAGVNKVEVPAQQELPLEQSFEVSFEET